MHKTTQRCTLALGALVALAGLFGAILNGGLFSQLHAT